MQIRKMVVGAGLALLMWSPLAGPSALDAQVTGPGPDGRWPLQPNSPGRRTLAPFMEGWYANEDGSFSISFGYLNLNTDTLYIPVGEDNFLEPAQFNGMQPTVFFRGTSGGSSPPKCPRAWRARTSGGRFASRTATSRGCQAGPTRWPTNWTVSPGLTAVSPPGSRSTGNPTRAVALRGSCPNVEKPSGSETP